MLKAVFTIVRFIYRLAGRFFRFVTTAVREYFGQANGVLEWIWYLVKAPFVFIKFAFNKIFHHLVLPMSEGMTKIEMFFKWLLRLLAIGGTGYFVMRNVSQIQSTVQALSDPQKEFLSRLADALAGLNISTLLSQVDSMFEQATSGYIRPAFTLSDFMAKTGLAYFFNQMLEACISSIGFLISFAVLRWAMQGLNVTFTRTLSSGGK